jgi:hypothetical protein
VASGALAVEASATFEAGSPLKVIARGAASGEVVLHYRHVNQAERWDRVVMIPDGNALTAAIPASATQSGFHLQYYVSILSGGDLAMIPGFGPALDNEPYRVVTARAGA